jgi:hypothetical protein
VPGFGARESQLAAVDRARIDKDPDHRSDGSGVDVAWPGANAS